MNEKSFVSLYLKKLEYKGLIVPVWYREITQNSLKKLWEKWVFEKWKKIKRKRLEEESKGVLRAALDVKTGGCFEWAVLT